MAADCDAADDVDMGEPGVANGGSRTAAAAGGAAAKKGSRRKSVGAVSANGEVRAFFRAACGSWGRDRLDVCLLKNNAWET